MLAGLSYKMGKAYDKAERAYVKCADSYMEANSYPCANVYYMHACVCIVELLLKDTPNKGHHI